MLDNADDPRHGTHNGYNNHGCRCEKCTAANRQYYGTGPGKQLQHKSRVESGKLKRNYDIARSAGYSPAEATRRQHWTDPLKGSE